MSTGRKKPISITLAAAVVICIITFILGFVISSFAFLDSRIETAKEKNAELTQSISEKEMEIKELKKAMEQKDENNILLAEQIQTHLDTIEKLNGEIANLKNDVDVISEAAINAEGSTSSFFLSFATLTLSQQLIMLVLLLVVLIFIISITCSVIASKSSAKVGKKAKRAHREKAVEAPVEGAEAETEAEMESDPAVENETEEELPQAPVEEVSEEPTMPVYEKSLPAVAKAVELLYRNKLEDSISDLGGFKFGITNFDEVLFDKRRAKSFGNAENGDFVAFMSSTESSKKLYIIPRNLVLSDSTVALRGVLDLFNLSNENGDSLTSGTIQIRKVLSPAVFACGDSGWAIESKGEIISI
ncbi:MAG: hypothetical protein IJC69_08495 [Clostridia bacterium]|nr:hypothetical protein [Clostridia bacterium]